jgi:hypothetical protein
MALDAVHAGYDENVEIADDFDVNDQNYFGYSDCAVYDKIVYAVP